MPIDQALGSAIRSRTSSPSFSAATDAPAGGAVRERRTTGCNALEDVALWAFVPGSTEVVGTEPTTLVLVVGRAGLDVGATAEVGSVSPLLTRRPWVARSALACAEAASASRRIVINSADWPETKSGFSKY